MSKKIQQLLPLIPFPGPRAWLLQLLAGKQQQCETRQLCKYKNMWTCNKIYARWNAAHARPGAATRVLRRSVAGLRKWRRQITAARRSREGRVPTEIKIYSFLLLFAWGSALRLWSAVWCIPRISMKLFNLCCGRQISTHLIFMHDWDRQPLWSCFQWKQVLALATKSCDMKCKYDSSWCLCCHHCIYTIVDK